MSLLIVLFILCFFYYLYTLIKKKNNYWTEKNIPQCKPLPIFGNFAPLVFQRKSMGDLLNSMYNQFPDKRYFGIYQIFAPNLVIKDFNLIKKITVKEFDTFPEHRLIVPEDVDPLFARNILFMRGGEKWQKLRSMLSPVFTSSKLKFMYPLMIKCANQFVDHYKNSDGITEFQVKDTFSRYTNDVIATIAFGVECNSFANPNETFFLMGKKSVSITFTSLMKTFMSFVSPSILKFLNLAILPREATDFFRKIITDNLKLREEKGIVRPDLLHLLNEARKGRMKYDEQENISDSSFAIVKESEIGKKQKFKYSDISDDDLLAQAVVFFLAGFDTSSTGLTFCAYELAVNPDVQQKLREEIDEAFLSSNEDFINYDELLSMKYLDMVVTESLRKWPPLLFIDRKAVKPFTIEPELPGEELIHFPEDTVCVIPVFSIQRDPKYYPNPEKFDPDRFNEENKHSLPSSSFLAFGMGPKSCIGSRFALLEVKLILVALLRNFEIVPVSKTPIPMVTGKKGIFLSVEGGLWLGLKKRTV